MYHLGVAPLTGCQWPPGWHYIFRIGDPNLNLHLPLLLWGGHIQCIILSILCQVPLSRFLGLCTPVRSKRTLRTWKGRRPWPFIRVLLGAVVETTGKNTPTPKLLLLPSTGPTTSSTLIKCLGWHKNDLSSDKKPGLDIPLNILNPGWLIGILILAALK